MRAAAAALAVVLALLTGCGAAPAGEARWQGGVTPPDLGSSPLPDLGPPTRLRIPEIGVDSPLVDLGLDESGKLQSPKDFQQAGWYSGGSRPGDVGPAVIAGHVDSKDGPAVFFRLSQLSVGDRIEVQRGDTWVRFRLVDVERYPKNAFPTDRVHGPTPNPELRLITCGGEFDADRRSYVDNIVAYAVLMP